MLKKVSIEFDYDSDKDVVTNVKCSVEGEVKKRKKTTPKTSLKEDIPLVYREENRLVINEKFSLMLDIDKKVDVQYEKKDGNLFPVIVNGDKGNKVTKSNTIAFRGKKNDVLAEFGTEFTVKEIDQDVWELIPTSIADKPNTSIEEVIEEAEQVSPDLITNELEDDTTDIDMLTFKL